MSHVPGQVIRPIGLIALRYTGTRVGYQRSGYSIISSNQQNKQKRNEGNGSALPAPILIQLCFSQTCPCSFGSAKPTPFTDHRLRYSSGTRMAGDESDEERKRQSQKVEEGDRKAAKKAKTEEGNDAKDAENKGKSLSAEDAELRASALRALQLMDFTTLADDDTHERVEQLCADAKTPFGCKAAVCIYPQFVATAKAALKRHGTPQVRVATVVNFPHGGDDIEKAAQETRAAVAAGADEIDVVLPYQQLIAGNEAVCTDLVTRVKSECPEGVLLKVIIEAGELKTPALIRRASEIAIKAGADFIKTSTGKVAVNATLESAEVMLTVIRDLGVEDRVGFKPAGVAAFVRQHPRAWEGGRGAVREGGRGGS